jgi:hypothetical protein
MRQPDETDLFGRFFLKSGTSGRFSGYYESVDAVRQLVAKRAWQDSVTGFYINATGNFDAVRLSYFVPADSVAAVVSAVDSFTKASGLVHVQDPERAHDKKISAPYGNEELRFRRFLTVSAAIGLEIMEANLTHARCLLATFRWQVMRARRPYEPHFRRTFESDSAVFRSLSPHDQEQLWRDLEHWPNPPEVDWAHLLVNQVLGCDWSIEEFLVQKAPLTTDEISAKVAAQGFQIPPAWAP